MSELKISELTKKYGRKTILKNVSMTFHSGHCYALLGRNGAGKSTLINAIMQRVGYSGSITLDGVSAAGHDRVMKRLFCMNSNNMYPSDLRVDTVIKITASMFDSFDISYVYGLAQSFGLDTSLRLKKLSTGYSTICKVILALASGADFIFLDEPVLGLDVNMRELFYKELARKISEEKSAFIISTHIIDEVEKLIEYAIILHNGTAIVNGDVGELLSEYVCVSGRSEQISAYTAGKNVLGREDVSVFSTALLRSDELSELPDGLSAEPVALQKLFYFLTGGNDAEREKK